MMPFDQSNPIDEILAEYLEALENGTAPPREEWLQAHPEAATELEAFLNDQDRFDQLLAPFSSSRQTTITPAATDTHSVATLERVGRYEILEEIAHGGMGIVYKARQHLSTERGNGASRIVALKMIRHGEVATEEERQRFHLEATTVAQLDHPHIVPLYEVGEENGCPYFSMKLIEGGDLSRHRKSFSGSSRKIARLMLAITRAIDHAHQRGILHRDLKPGNVLLEANGNPMVSDFGLARILPVHNPEETASVQEALTQSGAAVGTPAYMAPEQALASRSITTSVDVYGLGAILYELLTGRPPFKQPTRLETLMDVVEKDPIPPRHLDPTVNRDLETICLKCLQKEPGQRYPSAAELAADFQRVVHGEPIHARPLGPVARLARWCRREPLVAGLVFTVFLSISTGLLLSLWQWKRAEHHLGQSQLREKEATRQRLLEQERYHQVLAVIQKFCQGVSEDKLNNVAGLQPLQRELLEHGLDELRKFLKRNEKDPRLRRQLAKTHFSLGMIVNVIGSKEEAMSAYRKSLALYRELSKEEPEDADLKKQIASGLLNLANVQAALGSSDLAQKSLEEAQTVWRDLIKQNPSHCDYLSGLSGVATNLGNLFKARGEVTQARGHFDEAASILQQLHRDYPDNLTYQSRLARSHYNQGLWHNDHNRKKEALAELQRSRDLLTNVVERSQSLWDQSSLATTWRMIGGLLCEKGDAEAGMKAIVKGQKILEKLVQDNPKVTDFQHSLAGCYISLAVAKKPATASKDILGTYQKALDLLAKLLAQNPRAQELRHGLAIIYHNVGNVHHRKRLWAEAKKAYDKARIEYEKLIEQSAEQIVYHREISGTLNNTGDVLQHLKKVHESIAFFQEAIQHQQIVFDKLPHRYDSRKDLSDLYANLARAYRLTRQPRASFDALLLRQKLWSKDPIALFRLVTDYILTSQVVDKKDPLHKMALDAAYECLRLCLQSGHPDPNKVRNSPEVGILKKHYDLEPLFRSGGNG